MYAPAGVKTNHNEFPIPDTMRASEEHLSLVREQVVGAVRALSSELGAQAHPPRPTAAE